MGMTKTQLRLSPAQARDLASDVKRGLISSEVGQLDGRIFTPGPNAEALIRAHAAKLDQFFARTLNAIADKVAA